METPDGTGLFKILSDEKALDTNIMPRLIRPISEGTIVQWEDLLQKIIDYDNTHP